MYRRSENWPAEPGTSCAVSGRPEVPERSQEEEKETSRPEVRSVRTWNEDRDNAHQGGPVMSGQNTSAIPNRGRLKNGNPSGDYMKAPRCGARNRRGTPCQCAAMRGKRRCRLHGGLSSGARTAEGIHRIRVANWKDGSRSARLQREAKAEARRREQEIRAVLGWPVVPVINVRVRGVAKQPPADWAESKDTDE